jgi:transposase InsO family protein
MPGAASLAYHTPNLSKAAKCRLAWMDYYRKCGNAAKTCRYFGISRETFYYWKQRYHPYQLTTLESKSRRPKNTRRWEVGRLQELRIIALRKAHIRYGKMKLRVLYEREYGENISSWKIQRVIEKHHLYFNPQKTEKIRKKRRVGQVKRRITELLKEKRSGFLLALDTIVIYFMGVKRYILTAVDEFGKIGFARMYPSKHSKYARDFLKRLWYLFDGRIENITRDNGTEFAGEFDVAVQELGLGSYYSRPKTPTDNPVNERFNRTLEEEFIALGNMTPDCDIFNKRLTEWIIEYNLKRPHEALAYMTPVEFNEKYQVSGMYSSCTKS